MSEVYLGRGKERRAVPLGKLLGEGAAGKVYALVGMPGSAAKLYHGEPECRRHEAKIEAMIASPPDLPPATHNGVQYPQISWPEAKLYDRGGKFIGFLMPEIDFNRSTSLVNLLQKSSRRIEKLSDYYGYRVLVARNLASVFAELHRAGHHMIDMKPANLRFYPSVSWMAVVDTDGFSITGKNGRIAADVVSDEYIAGESWKKPPGELGEQQDLFALAVIIFQLLNNGLHPFAGAAGGSGQATDLQARILEGLYAYGLRVKPGLVPSTASVHRMFRRGTRMLFDSAFQPRMGRPSAEEWRDHLDVLMAKLTPCAAKPEHVHFGSGCGFCGHEARIAVATPRPSPPKRPPSTQRMTAAPRPSRPMPPPSYQPMLASRQFAAMAKPRRRRLNWAGLLAVAAVTAAGASTYSIWGPLLPGTNNVAYAADLADAMVLPEIPEAADAKVDSFAKPREYLILPAAGALSVPLRRGPGTDFAVIERLNMHDAVIGRGVSNDANGFEWVWITRTSDGAAGFVRRAALMQRAQAKPVEVAAAAVSPGSDTTASKIAIEVRYRHLLGNAEGYDRSYLSEGQRAWESERARCADDPEPSLCRKLSDARRRGDLDGWSEAERIARPFERAPTLTAASLDNLP